MCTFGWEYFGPGHMRRGPAWWILPWVMPAVLAICFAKNLDTYRGAVPGLRHSRCVSAVRPGSRPTLFNVCERGERGRHWSC